MAPADEMADPPQGWAEALERAEADLAAGRVVDGEVILAELRASIARMEDVPLTTAANSPIAG